MPSRRVGGPASTSEIETTRELARSEVATQLDADGAEHVTPTTDTGQTTDADPTTDADSTAGSSHDAGEASHDNETVTLLVGNDSATINPPETVESEVVVDSALIEAGTRERVSFALEWDAEAVDEDDELEIT